MKHRPLKQLCGLLATAAVALVLIGCNGSSGQNGANGTNGINGINGTNGTNGTNTVVTVNAAGLTPEEWGNLSLKGAITSATAGATTTVNFSVTDAYGVPVSGLGFTKFNAATDKYTSYSNMAFIIDKLVPGTNGSPSQWVNYIVTTTPTVKAPTAGPSKPGTDNIGTLVDHGDGTYTYTFGRDITQTKAILDAATYTAPYAEADLDDVTFQSALTHRIGIQIGGNARGTSTNTPDGSNTGVPAVLIHDPVNLVYDFIPATGKPVAATDLQRNIVDMAACNSCHTKLSWHGSARVDVQYCVLCHNDQQKYGWPEAVPLADGTGWVPGVDTRKVEGIATGNLPRLIHMIHMGEELTKTGWAFSDINPFDMKFPQDLRNCTKCHTGANPKTPQGDNWKNVPSRLACGACHDNVDFKTGANHLGGAQADDSLCSSCHGPAAIPTYHVPLAPPDPTFATGGYTNGAYVAGDARNLPPGAVAVTYTLKSVTLNATGNPVFQFVFNQNGTAVPFNTFGSGKTELWDNFVGSPSLEVAFAVPQDGIAAPADFNSHNEAYLKSIWNGTATGAKAGTMSAPDPTTGLYTVILTGIVIPANAHMVTGGIGYTYNKSNQPLTQINIPKLNSIDFTYDPVTQLGGLQVPAPNVWMPVNSNDTRRAIVDSNKCNNCHRQLGEFTQSAFHAGERNSAETCAFCHNANTTSSGWAADSRYFIHGIHGANKRTVPFTWQANSATDGFFGIGFPGAEKVDMLRNCEACHVPGSYDFSNATNAAAVPNMLWPTVGAGTYASASTTAYMFSPYVALDSAYGSGFSFSVSTGVATPAATTTLVNSPIASACSACHDGTTALAHMQNNGGTLYQARGAFNAAGTPAVMTTNVEQCLICHGSGTIADIRAVHLTF